MIINNNELPSNFNFKSKETEPLKDNFSQYKGELLICKNKLKVIERLSKEQLNTVSSLQSKIVDYERQIIQNYKTLEEDNSKIALLQIKNIEKTNVISSYENQIDELILMKKNYENQLLVQSEKIVFYLKKIEKLQNSVRELKWRLDEADMSANTSFLNRIFKKSN